MYVFGTTSIRRAEGVNTNLFTCARRALSKSKYDMTIPWRGGFRTAEEQNELYKDGSTRADGYDKMSYHQSGNALDIKPCSKDKETINHAYTHFAKLMFREWQRMLIEDSSIGTLEWGGLWKNSWDIRHYEVKQG
jgi:peptidoglycan L-alanyl-D-glutamate endopeptidase CwlK